MKISLLVIRCLDIEVSKNFYELLGLSFTKEKHGNGPSHYSCEHAGCVFELYPNKGEPSKDNSRLGFKVWKVSLKISHPLSHTILRAIQFMLLLTLMAVKLNLASKAITNRARFARFAGWTVRKLRLCGFASQKYSTKPQLPNRPCTQRYMPHGIGNMMKTKLVQFVQHLYHKVGDEEKAEEYLDDALPLIGLIVMHFNSLESSLDSVLCESFSDRSDSKGLIVLNQMSFSAKVELLKRFCDDLQISINRELIGYEKIINNLKESARLRNLVVHAHWESTNEEGYTYVRLKMSKKGMQQEYVQFTPESLQKIIELIIKTYYELDEFWGNRNDALHSRT